MVRIHHFLVFGSNEIVERPLLISDALDLPSRETDREKNSTNLDPFPIYDVSLPPKMFLYLGSRLASHAVCISHDAQFEYRPLDMFFYDQMATLGRRKSEKDTLDVASTQELKERESLLYVS